MSRDLSLKLGREPNIEELAEAMKMPDNKVQEILRAMATESMSLDSPVGEDLSLQDYVQSVDGRMPDKDVTKKLLATDLLKAINTLSAKEKRILMDRYGLKSGKRKTLAEIGKSMGYSKERIRQIEERCLRKLRANDAIQHLREYLVNE